MAFLFYALITLILIVPLTREGAPGAVVVSVAFIFILISGVYAVSDNPRHRLVSLALGGVLILGYLTAAFMPARFNTQVIGLTFGTPFFIFVTHRLLMYVSNAERVGQDELYASASAYLMFGFTWTGVYGLVEFLQPGSFSNLSGSEGVIWDKLFYFSFVTLTTLGYGDVAPLSDIARHTAILESIAGVLTLSFLVARIVSLYRKGE